jgi:hypothetical protein
MLLVLGVLALIRRGQTVLKTRESTALLFLVLYMKSFALSKLMLTSCYQLSISVKYVTISDCCYRLLCHHIPKQK